MSVILLKNNPYGVTSPVNSDYTMALRHIIRMAFFVCGVDAVYSEDITALLQGVILNLQAEEIYLWSVNELRHSFSAPSKVLDDVDGETYMCYRSHTANSANRPQSGSDWSRYWYKGGQEGTGSEWGNATSYTATGDFELTPNILQIEKSIIRWNNTDYPVESISSFDYEKKFDKQITGLPREIYLEIRTVDDNPVARLYPQIHEDSVDEYLLILQTVNKAADLELGTAVQFYPYYYAAVYYLLAKKIAAIPSFQVPIDRISMIREEAAEALKKAAKLNSGGTMRHKVEPV